MSNSFTNIKLSKENLESYIVRSEILKAVSNVFPVFEGEVLDSGCGSMPYKEIILSNQKVKNYVGLDIESSLDYEGVRPDFFWDGKIMPFEDASFDVVFSTEVLEHVPNPDEYLTEVKRVLKPGGMFFFTVPFLMSLHEVPHDYYRYTPFSLEMIFKRVGFTSIKINPMGGYNAALAQMLGLWVNMYLWGRKKKLMRFIAKPIISFLYKKDKAASNFNKSTMIVGLSGTIIKPMN
ncbi:ubiquinone/menaquinone biosynthesis C-methylase UbiE [Flavobacterium sp. 90]|uniref:class I SAM-dependent methyltransferase n=1 Tax=unclassified Flavobacterium TaxID=196869 RepID=UPI000EAC26CD|nr:MULTISPECIES: methyltransferase domain-containing protein [unclassified Flavobacterium]RKR10939.1 ubiquinone/menaquinone biosynthesis C-methylase UbiE [Flavobacterium sp. 81]TCK54723.1 ubiquinone/menaquinone biosynthesis C-methylase UbiE [Flavobacterium sp. 90]